METETMKLDLDSAFNASSARQPGYQKKFQPALPRKYFSVVTLRWEMLALLHLDNRAREITWEISERGCQIIGRKTRFLITGQASYMKI